MECCLANALTFFELNSPALACCELTLLLVTLWHKCGFLMLIKMQRNFFLWAFVFQNNPLSRLYSCIDITIIRRLRCTLWKGTGPIWAVWRYVNIFRFNEMHPAWGVVIFYGRLWGLAYGSWWMCLYGWQP